MVSVDAAVFLGFCIFATFSLVIPCEVKTRERFMGIGHVWSMWLVFAVNAIYPLATSFGVMTAGGVNPSTRIVDNPAVGGIGVPVPVGLDQTARDRPGTAIADGTAVHDRHRQHAAT